MPTVKSDLLDGAEIQQDGNSISRTRIFYVCGLSATNPASAILPLALNAPGIPQVGDCDPDIPGLYCRQRRVLPGVGPDDATIYITYKSPDGTFGNQQRIEVGATASEVLTEKDRDGNPVTIAYTAPGGSVYPTLPGKIPTLKSRSTLVITRLEPSSPDAISRQYTGCANSSPWHNGDANQWRCLGIVGRSTDGGQTYIVTYSFEFNPDGWFETLAYPNVPLTPSDIQNLNGYAVYAPLPQADFNALGL